MEIKKAIGIISRCEDCPKIQRYTSVHNRFGQIFVCGLTNAILTPVIDIDNDDPFPFVKGLYIPENCPLETV